MGALIGDVANSKRPLLIIPKVQLRLCVTRRSATALAHYPQKCNCACALSAEVQLRLRVTRRSWQKLFAGKNFVKILVTAQTQLRSYSEQQRAFGNSNICNCKGIYSGIYIQNGSRCKLCSNWIISLPVQLVTPTLDKTVEQSSLYYYYTAKCDY